MDDLLADFLMETHEGLTALDAGLVRLERNPQDDATLSEVFRVVHTIKGTCGFLGLSRLETLGHAAENLLGRWRDRAIPVTQAGVTLVLRALDGIRAIVAAIEATGSEPPGDDAVLIAALNGAAAGEVAAVVAIAPASAAPSTEPSLGAEPDTDAAVPMSVAAASPPVPSEERMPEMEAAPSGGGTAPQTIRVAVEVLEDLMMLVSELVLTRNQLLQLARAAGDNGFTVPLQRLSHITSDLQEGVMKTRMQPIGNAWAKLPRLVRDLSVELGKKITLEMRGAETELDRQVLELIKDPLTHMVRNSGDHGLEGPVDRRKAGKSETGRITLNAYHEGGHIIIEIADDGRGLNTDRIRAKALSQGLATETELAAMSERDVHRFIFNAGFSTAAAVTAVSGRGVGMDVVKTNIEKIGGTIDVRSRLGQGTAFVIKIPLTLAIVSALIVESGGERFAIPQIGVVELVRVGGEGAAQLERIKDALVLRLRNRLLPLVNLAGLLRLGEETAVEQAFVVVTQVGAHVFGIIVDRVFDTEEIVVKPVAPILRHVTMFSGNTILGDGSVIMILDPNGIARATGVGAEAGEDGSNAAAAGGAAVHSGERTPLLLFRADGMTPKAVPLGLVARLENVEAERIEMAGGRPVVQYRGKLMPLVPLSGGWMAEACSGPQPILVFSDNDRAMGLVVEEILDVVEARLSIDSAGERPGYLGSAVIDEKVTDILDTSWWLRQGGEDWFSGTVKAPVGQRVLVVEDSSFFRNLVVPAISAGGYEVTAVATAIEALRLREAGQLFDAIVSDIVMPEMDGIAFARTVREAGPWRELPMIALTGQTDPADVEVGRAAGFTDYVPKYDRAALLDSLRLSLAPPVSA